ncbi:MAG: hypothetical protein NVSMB62_18090 [Acidobacteriaceae bacterium]
MELEFREEDSWPVELEVAEAVLDASYVEFPADAPFDALALLFEEPEVVEALPPLFAGLLKVALLAALEVPAEPALAYSDDPALLEAPLLVLALVDAVLRVAAPVSASVVRRALLWVDEFDAAFDLFAF